MQIKKDYIVEKRNVLNEIRTNNMTLQELRFFSIYLSKINSRDSATRVVRFSIEDFKNIMELGRLNIEHLKFVTNSLLSKVVNVPLEKKGSYTAFQLFKECTVNQDENNAWYVEIDAHDKALPLMFDFKERYFSYNLWNALSLKSSNQLRMYEILKQYEKIGYRIIEINELKELLGLKKDEYKRWSNFKTHVLDVCKSALEENTDIQYNYTPHGKKGRGGKILELKFDITKNINHKDFLELDKFLEKFTKNSVSAIIDIQENTDIYKENTFQNESLVFYSEACNNEFNEIELQLLYNLVIKIVSKIDNRDIKLEYYDYFKRKYDELNYRDSQNRIEKRFAYIKKLFELDLEFI